ALLLSCACVHVLAEEVPAADLSDQVPDTESETKICPNGTELFEPSEPGCSGGGHPSGPLLSSEPSTLIPSLQKERNEGGEDRIPVTEALGEDRGVNRQDNTQDNLHVADQIGKEQQQLAASSTTRPNSADSLTGQGPNHDREQTQDLTHQGGANDLSPTNEVQPSLHNGKAEEKSHENSEEEHNLQSTGGGNGIPKGPQISRTQVQEPSSAGTQDANENKNNADNQNVSSGSTTTNDAAPTQSSSTSTEAYVTPSPQETKDNNESGNKNAESGTTPEGNGSTNKPANEESTTNTTTTTSTLPPELTNNKKGDADSSSSIISSVWVRVPLLIVVTLACILV
ncbi:uncharacterized protein TM35_001041010, partial [Trypanosoma theileri]